MYKNIGKTIMGVAIVLGWLGLIVGVIAALAFALDDKSSAAWISLASGAGDFVFSLFLYAFGQLVDDTQTLREHLVPTQADTAPAGTQQGGGEQAERAAFHADVTKEPERQKTGDSEADETEIIDGKRFDTKMLVIVGVVVLLFLILVVASLKQ